MLEPPPEPEPCCLEAVALEDLEALEPPSEPEPHRLEAVALEQQVKEIPLLQKRELEPEWAPAVVALESLMERLEIQALGWVLALALEELVVLVVIQALVAVVYPILVAIQVLELEWAPAAGEFPLESLALEQALELESLALEAVVHLDWTKSWRSSWTPRWQWWWWRSSPGGPPGAPPGAGNPPGGGGAPAPAFALNLARAMDGQVLDYNSKAHKAIYDEAVRSIYAATRDRYNLMASTMQVFLTLLALKFTRISNAVFTVLGGPLTSLDGRFTLAQMRA